MSQKDEDKRYPVLVVEDEDTTRLLTKTMLSKAGWEVLEARDGLEGLAIIREYNSKGLIVLADLEMPKMDGLTMLQEASEANIESIVMTAYSEESNIVGSFHRGAREFIVKPVKNWETFLEIIEKANKSLKRKKDQLEDLQRLEQQADWHYWKAMFLSSGNNSEVGRVLDALHIQFNQDTNYAQILNLLQTIDLSQDPMTIPKDLFQVVVDALRPVARMADGIGIAQNIMHQKPTMSSIALPELYDWFAKLISEEVEEFAKIRGHELNIWLDESMKFKNRFLHFDEDLFRTALLETLINAMKYSNDGDLIRFNVQFTESEENALNILVTNPARPVNRALTGTILEGIPREIEELIFRFFIRFSIDTTVVYPEKWPMGLGLPLVRQVMTMHDGKVGLHNESWHLGGGANNAPARIVSCRIELPTHEEGLEPPEEEKEDFDANIDFF